jgi:hypothetical protein
MQEDTRNSFLRPPTNVVLERELRRDSSLRRGEANGSILESVDETSVFASHDLASDISSNGVPSIDASEASAKSGEGGIAEVDVIANEGKTAHAKPELAATASKTESSIDGAAR